MSYRGVDDMMFQDHRQVLIIVFRVEIATSEPVKRFIEKIVKISK